jgi:putative MATE family efflux protein
MSAASAFSKQSVDLINDPIDQSLRRYSLPLALSFVVNMVYSFVDRFYVSRLGDAATAAIGATDQVMFVLFTIVSGIAVGAGIIVSRRFGEGDNHGAMRTGTQALVGIVIMALTVTVSMYVALPQVPVIMRMKPEVAVHGIDYLSTLLLGFTFQLSNFHMFTISRSTGNTMFPTVVLITTVVVNAVVAPFLIFGIGPFPEMGMSGAGLATAIGQMTGTAITLTAMLRGSTGIRLDFSQFKLDWPLLRRVALQGFPASVQMLSVSMTRAIIFMFVGELGTSTTAAYTLGLSIDMLVMMTVFAVGIAMQTATGQNIGAGKPERVWLYYKSACKQLTYLMVGFGVIVYAFGDDFILLYTTTPDTVREATEYMRISVFGYIFFAYGLMSVRVISGAGASILSMSITAGSLLLLQVPLAYVLSHWTPLESSGIWIGLATGYAVFAGISYSVVRSGRWMKAKA